MHLVFITDEFTEAKGFELTYETYVSNCGGEIEATEIPQQLSWTFDGTNPNCMWNVKTDIGHYVHIETTNINLPEPTEEYNLPVVKS